MSLDVHDFSGRNALVTGGASGIGRAVAILLAERGAHVVVFDVASEIAPALPGGVADRIELVNVDLTDAEAIRFAMTEVGERLGVLHVLVNNAGIGDVGLIETLPFEVWIRVVQINLTAPFLCLQAALPYLRAARGAAVVNMSSIAGKRMSASGGIAYTSTKSGVLGFTRHAAFELARDKIRVNAICPGPTLTPMIEKTTSPGKRKMATKTFPLGAWIDPLQVAEGVAYLASPAAAMCTGTSLDIDAGVLVSNGDSYEAYFEHRAEMRTTE